MDKQLTYKEIEDLLADYAFGRLNPDQKKLVDNSITNYPELEKEVNEIREVFSKVEKIDLNAKFEDQTRNISVKVMNKLEKKRTRAGFMPKVVFPTLGVLFIGYLSFFGDVFKPQDKTDVFSKPLISEIEISDIETNDLVYFISTDNLLDEETELELIDNKLEYFDLIIDDSSIEELTNHLTEEDFNSIIEEIYEFEIDA